MTTQAQDITDSTTFLGKEVTVTVDRQPGQKHPKYDWHYPINYGYIENTHSPDTEELDAYIIGIKKPMASFTGVCIAVIRRDNDNDDKLIVVPRDKVAVITDQTIRDETHFQEQYFKSSIIR